ncbi:MAG: UvrD-helicase domain-containing protein, partial [Pseudomonadales bacterium]
MTPKLADAAVREQALDASQSFCVTAPAGSGKTELLTQRFLTLLARVDNPEEVLAITFTRKAVAEMRARVVAALRAGQSEDEENAAPHRKITLTLARAVLQRDADNNWQLLVNPGRLRIFTFDAFSAYLVRQMPITSGFGGAPSQEDNAEPLYRDAINRLFARLEDDSALAADIATVVIHLDCRLAQLENLLVDLLRKRDQWRSLYAHLQDGLAAELLQDYLSSMVEELLSGLSARLQVFAGPLCEQIDYAAGKLAEHDKASQLRDLLGISKLPGVDLDSVTAWQQIRSLLLTDKNEWRKTVTVNQGFPAGNAAEKQQKAAFIDLLADLRTQEDVLDMLCEIRELPEHSYAQENWPLLQALLNVMRHLLAYLELSFQSAQKVDFSAISLRALDALGALDAPSDLALRLDYQIQHILVDEFQDTSRVQHELLARLTAEWGADPEARKTLCIVGDAMQSIYAFRNARVGLFMYARKHGIADLPLQPLELNANFRSEQAIVDWVNATFKTAFPPLDDLRLGATPYVDSIALNPNTSTTEVQTFAYFDTLSKHAEAQKICELIATSRTQDPDGSIVILLRTRKHAEHILPALSAAGISWQAAELDKLSDQACVTDLISITRALLNPADRIAWLALLRLPMCGLTLKDLLAVAGPTQETSQQPLLERIVSFRSIPTLSEDGKPRMTLLSEVFGAAWQARQRKPLHYAVQGVWQALGGDAVYATTAEQDYCKRYFTTLEQLVQSEESLHWQLIEDSIERQYAESANESGAAVQIMTIHKAKGLEFDTVLLPSLHQRSQGDA